jgi:hypothetical protein
LLPTEFEVAKRATPFNCEADASNNSIIYEFKSWSPNANDTDIGSMGEDQFFAAISGQSAFVTLANNSYSNQPNAYTQFLCYLQNISSMDDLNYYFDEDLLKAKGQSNPKAYVKERFRDLLLRPDEQNEVFNAIWYNTTLRGSLFPDNGTEEKRGDAKLEFKGMISNVTNDFYNFIKIK